MGKHFADFGAKTFDGLVRYKYLWDHRTFCPYAPDDSVAQKVEAFCDMGDFRLVLCERQSQGAEESSKFLLDSVGFRLRSITQHNKVVGVSDVEDVSFAPLSSSHALDGSEGQVRGFHILVELMEVYVGRQGADDAPLWCACQGFMIVFLMHHPCT